MRDPGLTSECTRLSDERTLLLHEKERLSNKVNLLSTENSRLSGEAAALLDGKTSLNIEIDQLSVENTRLSGEVAALWNENARVSNESVELSNENTRLSTEAALFSSQLYELRNSRSFQILARIKESAVWKFLARLVGKIYPNRRAS